MKIRLKPILLGWLIGVINLAFISFIMGIGSNYIKTHYNWAITQSILNYFQPILVFSSFLGFIAAGFIVGRFSADHLQVHSLVSPFLFGATTGLTGCLFKST